MSRLAVDPAVLAGAGVGLIGVGEGLSPAVAALSAAFNANSGQDTAGVMFGRHYGDAGRGIMESVAAGINALLRTGYGVQVSAVNYSRAEAHSDLSRRAQPLQSPPCPADVSPAGGPCPSGGGVAEPALWAVVELLVGDLWPSGSPTQMRVAAGAWRAFASELHRISFEVSAPYNTVAAQEIPEGESIKSVIRELDEAFGTMARGCEELATTVEGFATGVENAQNANRRLLARLGSIGSIVGIFFEFIRGHGEEDLEQIAADIRTVMGHLKNEADANKAMIEQALRDFEALNQVLQIVADREFHEFFGEDVGDVLSGLWRAGGDVDRGVARWTASTVEGREALDPTRFVYDTEGALQTWKGLAQMAQVVTNPAADPELTKEIVKGLARVDEWKTQRPLTALTENVFDVGTLFLGPEAAAGGVAKAGELGDIAKVARGLDETPLTGASGKLGEVTRPVGALDEITTRTGQLTKELETTALAPAGGKPVGGPVIDKSAGMPVLDKPGSAPVVDKPATAPVGDAKPVGGKPVPPDKLSGLPASPVESKASAVTVEAKASETTGATKASVTGAGGSPHGELAPPVVEHPGGRPDSGQPPLSDFPHSSQDLARGNHPGAGATTAQHPGGPPGGLASAEEPGTALAGADHPGGPRPSDHVTPAATPGKAEVLVHGSPVPEKADVLAQASAANESEVLAHAGAGRSAIDTGADGHPGAPVVRGDTAGHSGDPIGTSGSGSAHSTGDMSSHQDHADTPPLANEGPPSPLPPDSPLFDGYRAVDPGPEFTHADGSLIYPDDTLASKPYAIPGTAIPDAQLAAGTELQRFGRPSGGWMAPEGTPFSTSSLPPASKDLPFYRYQVTDPTKLLPGWRIEQSLASPWFHQPGGGVQFRIIAPPGTRPSVDALIEMGYLREVRYGR